MVKLEITMNERRTAEGQITWDIQITRHENDGATANELLVMQGIGDHIEGTFRNLITHPPATLWQAMARRLRSRAWFSARP